MNKALDLFHRIMMSPLLRALVLSAIRELVRRHGTGAMQYLAAGMPTPPPAADAPPTDVV